jgi:hypothetical protein
MSGDIDINFDGNTTSIQNLVEHVVSSISDREEQKEAERTILARTDPNLYIFLKEFYCRKFGQEENVLTFENHIYPVLVFLGQNNPEIDFPLGNLLTDIDKKFEENLEKEGKKYL